MTLIKRGCVGACEFSKSADKCDGGGSRNDGWDCTLRVNGEDGERVVLRMLLHVLKCSTFLGNGTE